MIRLGQSGAFEGDFTTEWVDLHFSFPCMVREPLEVSMALDCAGIVKCRFTQCVGQSGSFGDKLWMKCVIDGLS